MRGLRSCAIRREPGFGKSAEWMSARNPGDGLGIAGQKLNDARATDGGANSPQAGNENGMRGAAVWLARGAAEGSSCETR
ncbi:MAG TPA: hypothetical protein PKD54_04320 [Pirellulaceae bacterium]|nr:hypothetical protein [Pirellulaceae bacterium]